MECSFAHAAIEAYTKHCKAAVVQTDITQMHAIANKAFADLDERYISPGQFNQVFKHVLVPFAETHLFDWTKQTGVELEIALDRDKRAISWDSQEAWFRGKLDFVEFDGNRARLVDYKTGYSVDHDPFQMDVYAWLLFTLDDALQEIDVEIDHVRHNIQRVDTYERRDAHAIEESIYDAIAKIDADTQFKPAPGPHCLHCPYAAQCDAEPIVPDGAILTEDQARAAVETLAILNRDMKATKDALREYCVTHGNVIHNGAEWGFHGQGGDGFDDAERFFAAALESAIDPWAYLRVDATKVKKLMDRRTGEYPEPLQSIAVNRRSVEFGKRKA